MGCLCSKPLADDLGAARADVRARHSLDALRHDAGDQLGAELGQRRAMIVHECPLQLTFTPYRLVLVLLASCQQSWPAGSMHNLFDQSATIRRGSCFSTNG